MQQLLRRTAAAALAAILMSGLGGCKQREEDVSEPPAPTTAATTVATTAPPARYRNPLTGQDTLATADNRPVAFMIDNYNSTIRQKNIDKADFYVEAETEAGIPRIMAVFGSIENVPAEVGPCRSARTHFVKIAKAMDSIYCHIGGSTLGRAMIREKRVTDLDSLVVRSAQLKAVNGAVEHTKVFTLSKITAAIQQRGIATTTAVSSPYTFGSKTGTGNGAAVQVNISSAYKTSFTYSAATGLYTKHRRALDTDVHVSYDGDPIQVTNVIVMYDNRFNEDSSHISFTLNAGKGLLVSGGASREIRWSRTDRQLSFTETDGSPLTVAPGKTYVCLTSNGQAGKTVLK